MKEPKINVAHYTKLLKDTSVATRSSIDSIFDEFMQYINIPEGLVITSAKEIFFAKYDYYEINDIDETLFLSCIDDVYQRDKQYYVELAKAYYKDFDYTTANKRRVHREDSGSSSANGASVSSGDTENDTYGLPNKKVDNVKDGYLTNVDKSTSSDRSETSRSGESSLESDIVTTYDNEYLDLKRQFMRQIRNLMGEFIDRFEECFLHVYS